MFDVSRIVIAAPTSPSLVLHPWIHCEGQEKKEERFTQSQINESAGAPFVFWGEAVFTGLESARLNKTKQKVKADEKGKAK